MRTVPSWEEEKYGKKAHIFASLVFSLFFLPDSDRQVTGEPVGGQIFAKNSKTTFWLIFFQDALGKPLEERPFKYIGFRFE